MHLTLKRYLKSYKLTLKSIKGAQRCLQRVFCFEFGIYSKEREEVKERKKFQEKSFKTVICAWLLNLKSVYASSINSHTISRAQLLQKKNTKLFVCPRVGERERKRSSKPTFLLLLLHFWCGSKKENFWREKKFSSLLFSLLNSEIANYEWHLVFIIN